MLNFHYIEPHLVSYEGHTFNTCKVVLNELAKDARFANVNVVGSTQCPAQIRREFRFVDCFDAHPELRAESLISKVIFQIALFCFVLRGLKKHRRHISTSEGNVFYFNTAQSYHCLAVFFYILVHFDRKACFILTLRLSNYFGAKKSQRFWISALAIKLVSCFRKRVKFVTDSDLLAAEFEEDLGIAVHTLCIPHPVMPRHDDKVELDGLVVGILGSSRSYKGSLDAVKALVELENGHADLASDLTLLLHAFGEQKKEIIEAAAALKTIKLILRTEPLSKEEYDADLIRTDLFLLNYDPSMYARNTSGIFLEAMCLGKDAIVSRGTWMAYENSKLDLCDEVGPGIAALCEMIASVLRRHDTTLAARRAACRQKFAAKHSSVLFANQLTNLACDRM